MRWEFRNCKINKHGEGNKLGQAAKVRQIKKQNPQGGGILQENNN